MRVNTVLLLALLAPLVARAEGPSSDRYVIPQDVIVEDASSRSFNPVAWYQRARREEAAGNWRDAASAYGLLLSNSPPSQVMNAPDGAGRGPTRRYLGVAKAAADGLRRCYSRDPRGVLPLFDPSIRTELARSMKSGDPRGVASALVRSPVGPDADRALEWLAVEAESRGDSTRAAQAWFRLFLGAVAESRRRLPSALIVARLARLDDDSCDLSPAARLLLLDLALRRAVALCGGWGGMAVSGLEAMIFGTPVPGTTRKARELAAEAARRRWRSTPEWRRSAPSGTGGGGRWMGLYGTPYGPGPLHRAEGPAWRPDPSGWRFGPIPGAAEWIRPAAEDEETFWLLAPVLAFAGGDLSDAALAANLDVPWHPVAAKGRGWFMTEAAAFSIECETAAPGPWRVRGGLGGSARPHLNIPFGGAWVGGPGTGTWVVPLVVGPIPLVADGGAPMPGRSSVEPPSISRVALVAVDPEAEGRILWSTEYVSDGPSRVCYDSVTFASPPMSSGRTIYVGALVVKNEVESRLCAIDADTGVLRWQTPLATRPYSGRGVLGGGGLMGSAPIGLVPAGGGDLVVYVTNLGVVAACDALTGQVRWVVLAGSERPESRRLVSRAVTWGDNPPFVVGSSVVVTPQDSDLGLVLDRESGRLLDALSTRPAGASLWPGERDGVLYRYLVADGRGRMAFSGAALRIVDGGESVPGAGDGGTGSTRRLDEPAIGRGYWSGGVYYFPAASGLMAFDTRDPGAGVVRIMDWDRPTDSPCEVVAGEGWGMVVWRTGVWMVPLR